MDFSTTTRASQFGSFSGFIHCKTAGPFALFAVPAQPSGRYSGTHICQFEHRLTLNEATGRLRCDKRMLRCLRSGHLLGRVESRKQLICGFSCQFRNELAYLLSILDTKQWLWL